MSFSIPGLNSGFSWRLPSSGTSSSLSSGGSSGTSLAPTPGPLPSGARLPDHFHAGSPDSDLRSVEGGLRTSRPRSEFRAQIIPVSREASTGSSSDCLESVGHLDVGDRYASLQQNSESTVRAAGPETPGSASMTLTVEAPTSTSRGVSRVSSHTSAGFWPDLYFSGPGDEERRRRTRSVAGPSSGDHESVDGVSEASEGGGSTRYVLDVHDVHDMGGTPSSLSIRDRSSGDELQRFDLPPGDSRIIADLPPGEYSIDAQAGERPLGETGHGRDQRDNFSVDISTSGSSPASDALPN